MHMQIDEAGSNDQPARVKLLIGIATGLGRQSNLGNTSVAQKNIHGRVDLRGGVNQLPAFDQQAAAFSARHRTAPTSRLSS